jgi:hypothetical protein
MRRCGRRRVIPVVLLLVLAVVGFAASATLASPSPSVKSTTGTPCTRAHRCSPAECAAVGAHGGDCTTSTAETTTTPPPTRPRCSNGSPGGAGKDGQPGNDDCALAPPTPPPSTTTQSPSSSTTGTTTTTTTTTPTTTTAPFTPPTIPKSKRANPTKPMEATARGELPFTGSRATAIATLLGLLLLGAGLILRTTSPRTKKVARTSVAAVCGVVEGLESEITKLVREARLLKCQPELEDFLGKLRELGPQLRAESGRQELHGENEPERD